MTKIRTFKDLEVWKKAFQLAVKIIKLTEILQKGMSTKIISEQLIRASTSISSNIAEGFGSFSKKEFSRYLKIALKSSYETDNWLMLLQESISSDHRAVRNDISGLQELNVEITKMLLILHRKVESSLKGN